MHIATINYVDFYKKVFSNIEETQLFIDKVEKSETKAKIVIHQCARMLWLADRISDVAKGRPALQILFYLISAEAIAKIIFDFKGKNGSRKYVKRFFTEICSAEHQKILARAFTDDRKYLNLEEAIDYLYDIRCDVVHEGKYYEVHFNDDKRHNSKIASLFKPKFRVYISIMDIREIVLEGAVIAANKILINNYPLNE